MNPAFSPDAANPVASSQPIRFLKPLLYGIMFRVNHLAHEDTAGDDHLHPQQQALGAEDETLRQASAPDIQCAGGNTLLKVVIGHFVATTVSGGGRGGI